uniref:Uncharacterized protein n=1 Tax=Timema tahoe TaxID=61484 RepID=A0A7R9FLI0_9NEOP|nr:unnamed protein product [Timema tahoe]
MVQATRQYLRFRGADMLEVEEEFVVRKARRSPRRTRPHSMSQAVIGIGLRTIATPAFSADGGVSHPDLLLSCRRLQDVDVRLVAEKMGASWHLLGLRLNFSPETLDAIQTSSNISGTDVTSKVGYRESETTFAWRESGKPFRENHPQFTRVRFEPQSPRPRQSSTARN